MSLFFFAETFRSFFRNGWQFFVILGRFCMTEKGIVAELTCFFRSFQKNLVNDRKITEEETTKSKVRIAAAFDKGASFPTLRKNQFETAARSGCHVRVSAAPRRVQIGFYYTRWFGQISFVRTFVEGQPSSQNHPPSAPNDIHWYVLFRKLTCQLQLRTGS